MNDVLKTAFDRAFNFFYFYSHDDTAGAPPDCLDAAFYQRAYTRWQNHDEPSKLLSVRVPPAANRVIPTYFQEGIPDLVYDKRPSGKGSVSIELTAVQLGQLFAFFDEHDGSPDGCLNLDGVKAFFNSEPAELDSMFVSSLERYIRGYQDQHPELRAYDAAREGFNLFSPSTWSRLLTTAQASQPARKDLFALNQITKSR